MVQNTHAFLTIFSQQIFLVQNTHAFLTIFLKKNILVQITHAFLTIFLQQNILVQITHAFLTIFLKQIFLVQITHAFLTIFINQNILVQITHAFLTIFYTFFRKIQKKTVSWAKSHKLNMWFQNHSKWSKLLKKIAKRNLTPLKHPNSTDEKSRSADTKVGVREFAETGSEGSFRCGDPLP